MVEQILKVSLLNPLRFSCATILVAISGCRRPVRKVVMPLPRGETAAIAKFSHLFFPVRIPRQLAWVGWLSRRIRRACSKRKYALLFAGSMEMGRPVPKRCCKWQLTAFLSGDLPNERATSRCWRSDDDSCAGHASSFTKPGLNENLLPCGAGGIGFSSRRRNRGIRLIPQ